MTGARRGRALLWALALVWTALHFGWSALRYGPGTGTASDDVRRSLEEAARWRATGTLDFAEVLHPPLYYALLAPLAGLDFALVARALWLVQFPLYALALALLVRAVRSPGPDAGPEAGPEAGPDAAPPLREAWGVALVLAFNFQPLLETSAMHKVEGFEFVLLSVAIYAWARGRLGLAGAVTVVAAGLKYLPGVLLLYFVVRRAWGALRGALLAAVLVGLALLPLFGATTLWTFATRYPAAMLFGHDHEGTRTEASFEQQTLTSAVNRWFLGLSNIGYYITTDAYHPVPTAGAARATVVVVKALCLAVWLRALWPSARRPRGPRRHAAAADAERAADLLGISATLVLIFVLVPASRVHYGVLLLPGYVLTGLLIWRERAHGRWPEKLCFGLGWALAAMAVPGGLLNMLPPHPAWGTLHARAYLWFSLPLYGYLLLGAAALLARRRLLGGERGAAAATRARLRPPSADPGLGAPMQRTV